MLMCLRGLLTQTPAIAAYFTARMRLKGSCTSECLQTALFLLGSLNTADACATAQTCLPKCLVQFVALTDPPRNVLNLMMLFVDC